MSWNGDPLGYMVYYERHSKIQQDPQDYQQVTVTYPTTNVELTNLLIDNYYEVKVNAFNGKGHGPFSIPVDVFVGEAGKIKILLTHYHLVILNAIDISYFLSTNIFFSLNGNS